MYNYDSLYKTANRDRKNCRSCKFYNYLYYPYVRLDGLCSVSGCKVSEDYTYGINLKLRKEKI